MATVNFYLDRADKQGKCFIMMTYAAGSQKFRHSVKFKVSPIEWVAKKQRLKVIDREDQLTKSQANKEPTQSLSATKKLKIKKKKLSNRLIHLKAYKTNTANGALKVSSKAPHSPSKFKGVRHKSANTYNGKLIYTNHPKS